ncbi:MAG TPA: TRAP transporter small permease, partial [Vicinamibacterales bacterium]|nr:TRAP transporter small permease [Vicinamibacterales bacterium]
MALAAMAVLPLAEILLRGLFGIGIPGSIPFVQHLTLWVGFLGGALAAREGRLLALATADMLPEGTWRRVAGIVAAAAGAAVAAALCRGAIALVVTDREAGGEVAAGVPVWVAQLVLPVSLALVALRL